MSYLKSLFCFLLILSSATVIEAVTAPEHLYLIGNVNGQTWDSSITAYNECYNAGNGIYYSTIIAQTGGQFAFCSEQTSAWSVINTHRYANTVRDEQIQYGKGATFAPDSENKELCYVCPKAGRYYLKLDLNNGKVEVKEQPYVVFMLYEQPNTSSWNTNDVSGVFFNDGNGHFSKQNVTLPSSRYESEARITFTTTFGNTTDDWAHVKIDRYGPSNNCTVATAANANESFTTTTDGVYQLPIGIYDIEIDYNNHKISFISDNAIPSPMTFGDNMYAQVMTRTRYKNPVAKSNPDPSFCRGEDGYFYVYTGGSCKRSPDLVSWTNLGGKISLPDWYKEVDASTDQVWASDVTRVGANNYVALFSVSKWGHESTSSIGVATSTSPDGGWTHRGRLFSSAECGVNNSIDAQLFVDDDGSKWCVWGSFSGIYIVQLTDDCTSVKAGDRGKNSKIQIAGKSFEGSYIYKKNGYYYYFGSIGSCCENEKSMYTTVVARATKVTGPYYDSHGVDIRNRNTWYSSTSQLGNYTVVIKGDSNTYGPGHNGEIVTDDAGQDWMLYHGWDKNDLSNRHLYLDRIYWDSNGWPYVKNYTPSTTEQDGPVFFSQNKGATLTKSGNDYVGTFEVANNDMASFRVISATNNWKSEFSNVDKVYGPAVDNTFITNGDKRRLNVANNSYTIGRGKYTIDINSVDGTIAIDGWRNYSDLYIIGEVNGGDWGSSVTQNNKLAHDGNGVYSATFTTTEGKETIFALCTKNTSDWGTIHINRFAGIDHNTTLQVGKEAPCVPDMARKENYYTLPGQGTYRIVVDTNAGTILLTQNPFPEQLVMIHAPANGSNDWIGTGETTNGTNILTKVDVGVYEGKGIVLPEETGRTPGLGRFTFTSSPNKDWAKVKIERYGPTNNQDNVALTEGVKGDCGLCMDGVYQAAAGVYDMHIDLNKNEIVITKATSPDELYVLGNVNNLTWSSSLMKGAKCYNFGNGQYAVTIHRSSSEDGNFAFMTRRTTDWSIINRIRYAVNGKPYALSDGATAKFEADVNQKEWCIQVGEGKHYANIDMNVGTITLGNRPRVLYMLHASHDGRNAWNTNDYSVPIPEISEGVYHAEGVEIVSEGVRKPNKGRFTFTSCPGEGWDVVKFDRYGPVGNVDEGWITSGVESQIVSTIDGVFQAPSGIYDITINLNKGTIKIEKVGSLPEDPETHDFELKELWTIDSSKLPAGADARQAAVANHKLYIQDKAAGVIRIFDSNGDTNQTLSESGTVTNITSDEAGNVIVRDGGTFPNAWANGQGFKVYAGGTNNASVINVANGMPTTRVDFLGRVKGDILNGSAVMIIPNNGSNTAQVIKFNNRAAAETQVATMNTNADNLGLISWVNGNSWLEYPSRSGKIYLSTYDGNSYAAGAEISTPNKYSVAGSDATVLANRMYLTYNTGTDYRDGFNIAMVDEQGTHILFAISEYTSLARNTIYTQWALFDKISEHTAYIYHYYPGPSGNYLTCYLLWAPDITGVEGVVVGEDSVVKDFAVGGEGEIRIVGEVGEVSVFDIAGRVIARDEISRNIRVPSGVYIVQTATGKSQKVIVK